MNAAVSAVLLAVAEELAQQAKASLPELRDGEQIYKEWYANGIYYRETTINGKTFLSQYDFKTRKVTSGKVGKGRVA